MSQQQVEKAPDPPLQLLLGIQCQTVVVESLLVDEVDHLILNQAQAPNRFMERHRLCKANLTDGFILMGQFLLIRTRQPMPKILQDLLALCAQFRLRQLSQVGQFRMVTDRPDDAGGDLLVVTLDQMDQLA